MKAKRYKLKYVPTVDQLLDAGFRYGGTWIHENSLMFASRCFEIPGTGGELSVSICFNADLDDWDDFNNVLVLDEDWGQPYMPFYSENCKRREITGWPVLEYCIQQYNDFLNSFDFLEEVKEEDDGSD